MVTTQLFGALLLMGILGLVLGGIIGIFVKFFKVESDPRIELVKELLPNANCGGCGTAGCADFAKAVVEGKLPPSKCPVSSSEQVAAIARALGIDPGQSFPQRAVVRCGGDCRQGQRVVEYAGIADCAAASLVAGGPKDCEYGCLGLGTCAHKCPFGAIEIVNGLALVHEELCVGCGTCVAACPRGVIALVPAASKAHVYCHNPRKGAEKRKHCKVGCIGCRKCEKALPEFFQVDGSLASEKSTAPRALTEEEIAAVGCPTGALLTAARHLEIERHDPDWSPER